MMLGGGVKLSPLRLPGNVLPVLGKSVPLWVPASGRSYEVITLRELCLE